MKLIILDRDGVINQDSDNYIKSLEEWVPIPGSIEAIARLSNAGYTVVVATNQSGIGRGLFDLDELEAMHARLNELVLEQGGELSGIFYCPPTPDDQCLCRKPAPGLLAAIAEEFSTDLAGVPLIGDSLRDLQAGLKYHCSPILVRTGKGAATESKLAQQPESELATAPVFDDLSAAVTNLLETTQDG